MQAAASRGRGKSQRNGTALTADPPVRVASGFDHPILAARQDCLDALPIAAATIALGPEGPFVESCNGHFRQFAEWDDLSDDRRLERSPVLASCPLGQRITEFLRSEDPSCQFDTEDGRSIGGRHFTIRLARLGPSFEIRRCCLFSAIDRTAEVETERSLRGEMLRDSLTGLPNRLAFNEHVEAALNAPDFRAGRYAVLAVDMTRFSRINECMGAMAGDELLITFARRLVSALRPSDMLARTSGDEFGILLRLDRGAADALHAAERIKAVLTLPFRLSELEIRVDCAIGCAILNRAAAGADEALRNAQFALKRAKQLGATQIYEPGEARVVRQRFSMETELRRAVEAGELTLAFQPLVELSAGRLAGFEALARWDHEDRGQIPPDEFIPVAEESGLIVPLGRWALETAVKTLADWDRRANRSLPFGISVNLSAIQIARDDVPDLVARALAVNNIAGGRLTLELTESAIIHDPERAKHVLEALKARDVRIAMDDFGTGYTSLASLQRLPIDLLKIDRSFIGGMFADGDSAAIVRAVLSLARALGMETTAEGVDSEDLAEMLTELGCSYGQGFFYAAPLNPEDAYAYGLERSA